MTTRTEFDTLVIDDTVVSQYLHNYIQQNIHSIERRALRLLQSPHTIAKEQSILHTILEKCKHWKQSSIPAETQQYLHEFFQRKFDEYMSQYNAQFKYLVDCPDELFHLPLEELESLKEHLWRYYTEVSQLFDLYISSTSSHKADIVAIDFLIKKTNRLMTRMHRRLNALSEYIEIYHTQIDECAACHTAEQRMMSLKRNERLASKIRQLSDQEMSFLTEIEHTVLIRILHKLETIRERYESTYVLHKKQQ